MQINLKEGRSRVLLSNVIFPQNNYTIYYKSEYKGSSSDQVYGNMEGEEYKKLDSTGILLSQGLWEIKAVFKEQENDEPNTYKPSNDDPIATSGEIFINLNTESISVSFPSVAKGYVNVASYELRNTPSTVNNPSFSSSVYKYDTESSTFSTTPIPITYQSRTQLDPGIYYGVIEVRGNESELLYTDCIGFGIRSGLTTNITGYCDTYNGTTNTNHSFTVESKKPTDGTADIKNFEGGQFQNNGIYTIIGGSYTFIPTNGTYEKVLKSGQNITIDMNGNAIINANADDTNKTTFTINSGASLTIMNKKENTQKVYNSKKAEQKPNFLVNGGTLTLGSTASDVLGNIDVKGGPSSIGITKNGGNINLLAPTDTPYINIENTAVGISTVPNDNYTNDTETMNVNINMVNASIYAAGNESVPATGIKLDGTKESGVNYNGTINININGKGDGDYSIQTSGTYSLDNAIQQSCIYISNYSGDINLTFESDAVLSSEIGYAVSLVNCSGNVKITNKGTLSGSITSENEKSEEEGFAIYLENCKGGVTIYNSGTLSNDGQYNVYSKDSSVTIDNTTANGKEISVYYLNTNTNTST